MQREQSISYDGASSAREQATAQSRRFEAPQRGSLIAGEQVAALRSEWDAIQSMFVDDPCGAVARADALVKRAAGSITDSLARQRGELEKRTASGDPSTEELRRCLQQYRECFERLLA